MPFTDVALCLVQVRGRNPPDPLKNPETENAQNAILDFWAGGLLLRAEGKLSAPQMFLVSRMAFSGFPLRGSVEGSGGCKSVEETQTHARTCVCVV